MKACKLVEQNKRIEIFKFSPGDLNKYNRNDPHWNHNTKLSDYINVMGLSSSKDVSICNCLNSQV